jgi:hypothetical protein
MIERKRLANPPKEKSNRGRPSKYEDRFAVMAALHAAKGATDQDLADLFSVSKPTIWHWYRTYPAFGEAVKSAKALVFDARVERSMAERAIGYSVDTEEIKVIGKTIHRVPIRKHYPPDPTCCIFWLKNRQPDKWKDVHRHEHSGKVGTENLTADQLLAEIRKEALELGILPKELGVLSKGVAGNGTAKTKH